MNQHPYHPDVVVVDYSPIFHENKRDLELMQDIEYFQQRLIAAMGVPMRYWMDTPLFSQRLHAMKFNGLTWYPVRNMTLI
jgi:hypothetical protein